MNQWKVFDCQDIIDVRDGTHDSPKYVEKGYPLVTSKNLVKGNIDFSDINYISKTDFDSINKRSKVDIGDILYSMIGSIGNYAVVNEEANFAIKNVALFKFKDNRLDNRYFVHLLNSPTVNRQIESAMRGGTQKFVSLKILRCLQIPLPPLPVQKKIAAILDEADKLRQLNRQLIQKYEQLTQSLFLEMFGDPVSNPKGWEKSALDHVINFLTSGSRGWAKYYSQTGSIFLRIQNVGYDRLKLDDLTFVNAPSSAESKRTKVEPGDIVLSITADLGRTAVIPKNFPKANINQHLAILRLKEGYNPGLLVPTSQQQVVSFFLKN